MGAARTAIVCATILVMFLTAAGIGYALARRQERIRAREQGHAVRGDLNATQEAELLSQLDAAAKIFRRLGINDESNYGDPEIIRSDTRIDVGQWLGRYNKTKEKVSQ